MSDSGQAPVLTTICPFYNEKDILEHAIRSMIAQLDEIGVEYEFIVVNDGSTDGGEKVAQSLQKEYSRLQVVGYSFNRGRGYALRKGIAAARGGIIVTTEIDLSWGKDIVRRLYETMKTRPEIDVLVASPHLPGGGYRNVPWKRVAISRLGNRVIRFCVSNAVTMNTGMTRAYRREVIQSLPLDEDRKEFHLEVILKAQAFGHRLAEIPALLEWKAHKQGDHVVQRKSSSNVNKLIVSHSLFSLFANPMRYVWGCSVVTLVLCMGFLSWGLLRLLAGEVSVFVLLISLSFAIIALVLFLFGVIAQQGNMVQRELWMIKRQLGSMERTQDSVLQSQTEK